MESTMPRGELEERVNRFFQEFSIEGHKTGAVRGWSSGEVRFFPYAPDKDEDDTTSSFYYGKFQAIQLLKSPNTKIEIPSSKNSVIIRIDDNYYEIHRAYSSSL